MTQFYLLTKSGEVINITHSQDLDQAIAYFAAVKKLNKEDLLRIFNVK